MQLEGGVEKDADDGFEVWADNWPVLELFFDLSTQWQIGQAGPIGLRYEALPMLMDLHAIPPADRRDTLAALRVCEREALRLWNKKS